MMMTMAIATLIMLIALFALFVKGMRSVARNGYRWRSR